MGEVKERAERNRTIFLTKEQEDKYLNLCFDKNIFSKESIPSDLIIWDDCFNVFTKMPLNSVDLLIVDPPYNLAKTYSTSTFQKMNTADYEVFTRSWIQSVLPILKKTASVYVCCDWNTSLIIGKVLGEYLTIQNRITWQREKGRGASHNWKNGMEDIWFATVSGKFTFNVDAVKQRRKVIAPYRINGKPKDWEETENGNFRDTYPSNFWDDISIPYWSMPENTDHPTQKPEKLIAKLVLASSNLGDVVFDPFLGSGTSAVVAKKLGRRYLGIEREREYCALAQKRLAMAEINTDIQGYSSGVFWERNTLSLQRQSQNKEKQSTSRK